MAFLVLLLPLVCLDLLGDDLGCSRHGTLGTRSGGFPRCPRCPHRDGVPSVTSSLMSVSTAVFSASLRQMPSRGLSLLVAAAGGLSVEHSPGLPCGESPARMPWGFAFHPAWGVPPVSAASEPPCPHTRAAQSPASQTPSTAHVGLWGPFCRELGCGTRVGALGLSIPWGPVSEGEELSPMIQAPSPALMLPHPFPGGPAAREASRKAFPQTTAATACSSLHHQRSDSPAHSSPWEPAAGP